VEEEDTYLTEQILLKLEQRLTSDSKLLPFFSEWFSKQPVDKQKYFYNRVQDMVPESNGFMTEYNRLLTLLTSSHTAALPLGSTEQALAAMFYLTGYVSTTTSQLFMHLLQESSHS
jgi:hypothetical protein